MLIVATKTEKYAWPSPCKKPLLLLKGEEYDVDDEMAKSIIGYGGAEEVDLPSENSDDEELDPPGDEELDLPSDNPVDPDFSEKSDDEERETKVLGDLENSSDELVGKENSVEPAPQPRKLKDLENKKDPEKVFAGNRPKRKNKK